MEARDNKENEEMKQYVSMHGGIFSTKRYVEDLLVTPEMAEHFLKTMGRNRNLKPSVVQKYSNDMKNGKFTDCPALICFDWNGQLRDGQHRLESIIETGIPTLLSLKFDFSPETIYDKNAVRSTADTFKITGTVNQALASKEITSIINTIILAKYGASYLKGMSDNQKLNFAEKYGEEMIVVNSLAKEGDSHGVCNLGPVKAGFFAAIVYGVSEKDLSRFAQCANTFTATSKSETSATVFARQISRSEKCGSSIKRSITKITEEAVQFFVSGKERKVRFPGEKDIYFDQIELQF